MPLFSERDHPNTLAAVAGEPNHLWVLLHNLGDVSAGSSSVLASNRHTPSCAAKTVSSSSPEFMLAVLVQYTATYTVFLPRIQGPCSAGLSE